VTAALDLTVSHHREQVQIRLQSHIISQTTANSYLGWQYMNRTIIRRNKEGLACRVWSLYSIQFNEYVLALPHHHPCEFD
jgi:hypothetical protein